MGKIKHIGKIRALCMKTPVITMQSIKNIIGKDRSYAKVLVHNMVKRRELFRITKGKYSIHDDPSLAVFCFKPAYLGLQDALSIHNIWEQETIPIILTTHIIREGKREILGTNVLLYRLPLQYFFGIEYKIYGDFHVPVSDIEKTFIDLVFFEQPISKDILSVFRKVCVKKKIKEYAKLYPPEVRKKVLLYLQ